MQLCEAAAGLQPSGHVPEDNDQAAACLASMDLMEDTPAVPAACLAGPAYKSVLTTRVRHLCSSTAGLNIQRPCPGIKRASYWRPDMSALIQIHNLKIVAQLTSRTCICAHCAWPCLPSCSDARMHCALMAVPTDAHAVTPLWKVPRRVGHAHALLRTPTPCGARASSQACAQLIIAKHACL